MKVFLNIIHHMEIQFTNGPSERENTLESIIQLFNKYLIKFIKHK